MKKEMRKVMAAVLIASMMFLNVGCGNSDTRETKPENTETAENAGTAKNAESADLSIWLAGSGDSVNDQTYRAIFDKWVEENSPGSTYELSFIGWGEYATKLSVALASGEGPDVFMSGYGMFGSFQSQDYMLNLTEYIPQDWDGYTDIGSNFLEAGQVEGNLYGLLEPSTRLLMYRKDIAEQNGVSEEELRVNSLEDLENLAMKMRVTDDKGNLIVSGLELVTTATGPTSPEQIYSFISRNIDLENGGLWNENGQALFAGDEGIASFEYLKKLYDEGVSLPSESGDTNIGLISGLAAMSITTESSYGSADAVYPGQIGIIPSSLNTLLIGNFICVNSDSAYKDQAVDLLLYMFNEDSCKTKAEGLGMYSVRNSLDDWYAETFPHLANVPEYFSHSYAYGPTAVPSFNEGITIFRNASEKIMSTDADIAETLKEAASQWDELGKK